jgi:uncharacterized Zn finger protein (UPF0148 family)
MEKATRVSCPNCGENIDVNTLLAHQLEESLKAKYESQRAKDEQRVKEQQNVLQRQREEFEEAKRKENQLFKQRLEAKLKEAKELQEKELKAKIYEEQS